MKIEEFKNEAEKYKDYFNHYIYDTSAHRSLNCKAGRLEIYIQLYKNKLSTHIFTHPKETPFESEVHAKDIKSFKEGVEILKKEEQKWAKKQTWCEYLHKKDKIIIKNKKARTP